jgi:hypothetical protein
VVDPVVEPLVPVVPWVLVLPLTDPLVPVLLWSEPSVPLVLPVLVLPVVLVLEGSVPMVPDVPVVPDAPVVPVVEPCGEAAVPCAPVEAPADPDWATAPTVTINAPAAKKAVILCFVIASLSWVEARSYGRAAAV